VWVYLMSASTRSIVPDTLLPGAVSHAETDLDHLTARRSRTVQDVINRAACGDYPGWLEHVQAAAGCTRPIRLAGQVHSVDPVTGQVITTTNTASMPDGVIYKACGNRRASVCPSCSEVYRYDAYQLLRAGLAGGKAIPDTVSSHPAVFATFTAPSFGTVHSRIVATHTCRDRTHCRCRPQPCHIRRNHGTCQHGIPTVCFTRHHADDPVLGEPLCLDCYDHDHQVVWNLHAGELWRRTKQAIERHLTHLAKQRGLTLRVVGADGRARSVSPVRVSHGKAAEFQARGAIHFHALIRLDGVDPHDPAAIVPPPAGITITDLDDAIQAAASGIRFITAAHRQRSDGWSIAWGAQLDIRHISIRIADITDRMVAGYLAKYATKSTEATGHTSTRLTLDTIGLYLNRDNHIGRLIEACWRLGTNPTPLVVDYDQNPYLRLRRWAHMLGFGGHFLTKARHYTVTFGELRATRTAWRRHTERQHVDASAHPPHDRDQAETDETILVIGHLTYTGTGWHTTGDALLANTAAAIARERQAIAREESIVPMSGQQHPAAA
jgi:hypothetical protein